MKRSNKKYWQILQHDEWVKKEDPDTRMHDAFLSAVKVIMPGHIGMDRKVKVGMLKTAMENFKPTQEQIIYYNRKGLAL